MIGLLCSGFLVGQEPDLGGEVDPPPPPPPPPAMSTLVSMGCNAKNKLEPGSEPQVCCMSAGGDRAGTCATAKLAEERGFADSVLDSKRCGKQVSYEDGVCGTEELGPCAANRPKAGCVSQECPETGTL